MMTGSRPSCSHPAFWPVMSLISLLLIFLGETLTPLGFAHGSLYLFTILLAALSRNKRLILCIATASILLSGFGTLLSPAGFELPYVLANRLVSCLGIASMAAITIYLLQQMERNRELFQALLANRRKIKLDTHDFIQLKSEAAQQAEQLHNTLEQITDAFFMIDKQWRFTYVNRAAEHLLDVNRCDLLGHTIWDRFPNAEKVRHYYEAAVSSHKTVYFQEAFHPTDRFFDVRLFPFQKEGLAVYFQDITQAREQAEEVRKSQERFENVARSTTDAIWDWDIATDQLWWNDSFEALFGYQRDQLESDSRSWSTRIHPDDHDAAVQVIHTAIDNNHKDWKSEYRFRRKDGSYALVAESGFIIHDKAGRAIRAIGGLEDITEKRLLQERLGQSQRLEAIGQLTGGVAHDFNNLLTVIQGNTELLEEDLQGDQDKLDLINIVHDAANRASALTQQLLAFARRQPLESVSVDIAQLIKDLEPLLRRALRENIHIELIRGEELWPALVDASQLGNAILNLCLNAQDAMPQGGQLRIEISNVYLDKHYANQHIDVTPGQYVLLAVSDTGTGIADSVLDNVFDPFFTTKGSDKGSGLGLSMVYGFVKQSSGHIQIHSKEGQGTTIKIYLPRAETKALT